jgi:tryptophan synthase alpha subunit
VAAVGRFADAAVVGSALVEFVAGVAGAPDLGERVAAYVRWLRGEAAAGGAGWA